MKLGSFYSSRLGPVIAAAAVLLLTACPGENGTDPDPTPDTTPASIGVVSGNDQTNEVNNALGAPLVVVVKNAAGSGLGSKTVDWTVQAGGGMLSSATSSTSGAGEASVNYTLGPTAGTNTVRASVQGTPLFADFNAVATAPPPDVTPATIMVVSGDNQSAAVSSALSQPLVVVVRNAGGTALSSITVAWSVTSGGGSTGSPTSMTAGNGQASNTFTTPASPGTSTIQAAVQSNMAIFTEFTANATSVTNGSVSVQDNVFNPNVVNVSTNGKVTWTWTGGNPHNVTFVTGGLTNSSTQTSGTHEVTFASAGTFNYYCTIHGTPSSGMRGTVTVQ